MALVVGKGTVLDQDIASTLTPIAQVISIDHSGAEAETTKVSTLDTSGAGHEYKATGFTEGGTIDFEVYMDTELSGFQALTDELTTPSERAYSVTCVGGTEMTFNAAGISHGFSITQDDMNRATFSLKLDQLLTYVT